MGDHLGIRINNISKQFEVSRVSMTVVFQIRFLIIPNEDDATKNLLISKLTEWILQNIAAMFSPPAATYTFESIDYKVRFCFDWKIAYLLGRNFFHNSYQTFLDKKKHRDCFLSIFSFHLILFLLEGYVLCLLNGRRM